MREEIKILACSLLLFVGGLVGKSYNAPPWDEHWLFVPFVFIGYFASWLFIIMGVISFVVSGVGIIMKSVEREGNN